MSNKVTIRYGLILLILIILLCTFFINKHKKINVFQDNQIPFASSIQNLDLETIVKHSDLIIVGEAISDGVTRNETFERPEAARKKAEALGLQPINFAVTDTKIKVIEVISGSCNDNEITISQLGVANDDSNETKVKNGKNMIFILKKHPNRDNMYSSVNLDDGLYELDDFGKVHVLSKKDNFKKYNDLDRKVFEKKLRN